MFRFPTYLQQMFSKSIIINWIRYILNFISRILWYLFLFHPQYRSSIWLVTTASPLPWYFFRIIISWKFERQLELKLYIILLVWCISCWQCFKRIVWLLLLSVTRFVISVYAQFSFRFVYQIRLPLVFLCFDGAIFCGVSYGICSEFSALLHHELNIAKGTLVSNYWLFCVSF